MVVAHLDKFVAGLHTSVPESQGSEPSSTIAKRRFPTKDQNLAFVRRISFEYHPDMLYLAGQTQNKKTQKLIDNLRKRLRGALMALAACTSLIDRQSSNRIEHVSINHYRPCSAHDTAIPDLGDIDVDGALLDLVGAMRPVSACVSGEGLGLARFGTCTTLCNGRRHRSDGDSAGNAAAIRPSIRWIGHYDSCPTASFAFFARRIPDISVVSARHRQSDDLDPLRIALSRIGEKSETRRLLNIHRPIIAARLKSWKSA